MTQKVWHGDCLELMRNIPDKSVDMVLCDLPYGTTACAWDIIIPFDKLWSQYERICKEDSPILLFGSEPFSSHLRLSNINLFKYDWIWSKNRGTGIATAKTRPMKSHEIISVFYKKPKYFPIKERTASEHIANCAKKNLKRNITSQSEHHKSLSGIYGGDFSEFINPKSVIKFDTVNNRAKDRFHPTQKPVDLCEYLIKTYSIDGDLILDNCAGSGTTLLAAKNLNRQFIGIEKEKEYYDVCLERLK